MTFFKSFGVGDHVRPTHAAVREIHMDRDDRGVVVKPAENTKPFQIRVRVNGGGAKNYDSLWWSPDRRKPK